MIEERIGSCRLILGDSMKLAHMANPVDSIVTDPPYGMSFQSNHRKEKHGFISFDDDTVALQWATTIGFRHSAYIWMRWDNLDGLRKPTSLITWVKNNHSMGDLEHEHGRQTEVCAFYRGIEHFFPNGRPTDVIKAPRTGNEFHPTQKPVGLMEAVVSWTDGVVFDPFMGSGSTLVACANMRRPAVGIEIDPVHFETACRRVEEAYKRPSLFVAPPPTLTQEAMDL